MMAAALFILKCSSTLSPSKRIRVNTQKKLRVPLFFEKEIAYNRLIKKMRIYAETFQEDVLMELERREYLQKRVEKKDNGKSARAQLEVVFVVNRGNQLYYIQSALSIADPEKRKQEIH